MGVKRLLLALYPKKWRASFGDEFAALLEDTRLTPGVIADVVVQAGRFQLRAHQRWALVAAALAWSACWEVISVQAGLTANILWAPATAARAAALAATTGPWLLLAGAVVLGRWRQRGQG